MSWWDFLPCQGCGDTINCSDCRKHYESKSI